jgi:hypothetical protein
MSIISIILLLHPFLLHTQNGIRRSKHPGDKEPLISQLIMSKAVLLPKHRGPGHMGPAISLSGLQKLLLPETQISEAVSTSGFLDYQVQLTKPIANKIPSISQFPDQIGTKF